MPEDQPGKVLSGRYELAERIAQGGMAVVWRGYTLGAEGFRQVVAIKRIREGFEGLPYYVDMFVEEARVGTQLRHPNIAQVHDFGVDADGDQYLVTEWIDGVHLGDLLSSYEGMRGGAPWQTLAAIAIEVLRALDAAHNRRDDAGKLMPVLHRDVTPENILIDSTGIVKLADFGLARARDRGRMTHPDIVKGKLSYLAPEMVLGIGATPQSDMFSLAVILWEGLTGERLFHAPTDVEVIQLLRDPNIPLINTKRPEVPLALARIVHKSLDRDPERRFVSAHAMLEAMLEAMRIVPDTLQGRHLGAAVTAARVRLARKSAAG